MTKIQNGTVSITRDGIEYLGFFAIFGTTITVTYGGNPKATQVGGATNPEGLAMMLLSELVTEHLASPKQ